MNIYSPQVQAYAREHGVTDLQAYRALKVREVLLKNNAAARQRKQPLFERMLGISPDWNRY